jgi:serine/threonine-protein kinase
MGFWRPAAVKRLHESLARDPAFVSMLLDEARLGSQVRHPMVTEVLDLIVDEPEVCLVMQYVHGVSLRSLLEKHQAPVPANIASAILCDTLQGLHAAHQARGPEGKLLGIVHRDVSPHNLLVGADGYTRVTDFGIAKAVWRAQSTGDGQLKGKLAYMAPEQLGKGSVDLRADVFGAAVVLWELLAGTRLFESTEPSELIARGGCWRARSMGRDDLPPAMEQVVLRGLEPERAQRFETALQMAEALESCCRPASRAEVSAWVQRLAGVELERRAAEMLERHELVGRAPGAWKVSADTGTSPLPGARERTPSGFGAAALEPSRPTATSRSAATLFAAAALVVAAAVFFASLRNQPPAPAAVAASAPPPPVSTAQPAPEPLVAISAAPSAEPASSANASASSATAASPRPPRQPKRPAAPSCNPPYRTDAAGVKVYKLECL